MIPRSGSVLISVRDSDKQEAVELAAYFADNGFTVIATGGTADVIEQAGVKVRRVNKVKEGRPHVVDLVKDGELDLIINTTSGKQSLTDSYTIRREVLMNGVTYYTTIAAAKAACEAHKAFDDSVSVVRLQDLHAAMN